MKKRTIAIVGSVAALSLTAAPLAAASSSDHASHGSSRDRAHHVEKRSIDRRHADPRSTDRARLDMNHR